MEFKTNFNVGDKVLVIERLSRNDLYNRTSGGFLISRDEIREIKINRVITYTMIGSNKSIDEKNVFSLENIESCVDKLITLIKKESELE